MCSCMVLHRNTLRARTRSISGSSVQSWVGAFRTVQITCRGRVFVAPRSSCTFLVRTVTGGQESSRCLDVREEQFVGDLATELVELGEVGRLKLVAARNDAGGDTNLLGQRVDLVH